VKSTCLGSDEDLLKCFSTGVTTLTSVCRSPTLCYCRLPPATSQHSRPVYCTKLLPFLKNSSQRCNFFFPLTAKCFCQAFAVHLGNIYSRVTNSCKGYISKCSVQQKKMQLSCLSVECTLLHQTQNVPRSHTLKVCQFVKRCFA